MVYADLPQRGERAAPSFDGKNEELGRYFSEIEALYTRHSITDDQEKKNGAIKYLATSALERMWKSSDTLADPNQSYDDFKDEMYRLYPGSSKDVYTVHHLDALVGQSTRLGIRSSAELGEFHLHFRAISKYLISKNQMSQAEETWSFLRGLQPDLENRVRNRLQIIKPNHNPQDPYDLTDLYNAASFVLQGSAPATSQSHSPLASAPAQPEIKNETEIQALKSAVADLTEMFKNSMQQQSQRSSVPPPARAAGEAASKCNFCGLPGHFMRECEVAAEYMRLGKCKRSVEGKIVLPAGGVVPRHITGAWLRDRIDEYHRINPGQIAAAQMLMEMVAPIAQEGPAFPKASQFSVSKVVRFDPEAGQPGVFAYKRQFWPRSPTTAKGKTPQTSARITEVHTDESDSEAGPSKFTREFPPHVPEPVEPEAQDLIAEHPYAKASGPNANVAEPQPPILPLPQKNERAYTTTSNI